MPTLIEDDLEQYRGELLAHCYQMLGSVQDAEDLVQETMLRAWRARDQYDSALSSLRTWLHRIATNACLTALEGRSRRPLPAGAILILRDAFELPASEVADALDTSTAAVNSGLQRARARIGSAGITEEEAGATSHAKSRALVDRYLAAFRSADLDGLKRLLARDAVLEMPPFLNWYTGRDDYARFIARVFTLRGTDWRMLPLGANGQPAASVATWSTATRPFSMRSGCRTACRRAGQADSACSTSAAGRLASSRAGIAARTAISTKVASTATTTAAADGAA
jgi:RNA polymerase sigma-70 factor, ECF subfamily